MLEFGGESGIVRYVEVCCSAREGKKTALKKITSFLKTNGNVSDKMAEHC